MNKLQVLEKVREAIDNSGADPADELIAMGQALVKIGEALKGKSGPEARAIIEAVAALETGRANRN